ncbi:5'-methylthioadenosine/S-adenosylhomocysteine nucleosidase [Arvimicrobium flavum]|uniref:5'-methylthioadenosine/S-adenosylhomocysteine nucleosidase n=1 Tax=Arvimicrobium flavum TaxID=3393320 RepID=UPI00237C23E5|nr:5'-methylthioadenosine/S-adenosylhomocysteine nucleosidase [Mesorhizobium shangrilense]
MDCSDGAAAGRPPLADLAGRKVLFVMATQAEYGPHLQRLFKPLMTGVGPVEAGVRLGMALTELKLAGHLPDFVVSLGSAGSRRLKRTDIFQVSSVLYRDMDASAFGFAKHTTPYLRLPATLPLPLRIPGIAEASVSTSGAVIAGAVFDDIAEDMVEMETFACMRACQIFGVPLIGLRGISDGDTDVGGVHDWKEYLHVIDEKLAAAIADLEQAIAAGTLETRQDA